MTRAPCPYLAPILYGKGVMSNNGADVSSVHDDSAHVTSVKVVRPEDHRPNRPKSLRLVPMTQRGMKLSLTKQRQAREATTTNTMDLQTSSKDQTVQIANHVENASEGDSNTMTDTRNGCPHSGVASFALSSLSAAKFIDPIPVESIRDSDRHTFLSTGADQLLTQRGTTDEVASSGTHGDSETHVGATFDVATDGNMSNDGQRHGDDLCNDPLTPGKNKLMSLEACQVHDPGSQRTAARGVCFELMDVPSTKPVRALSVDLDREGNECPEEANVTEEAGSVLLDQGIDASRDITRDEEPLHTQITISPSGEAHSSNDSETSFLRTQQQSKLMGPMIATFKQTKASEGIVSTDRFPFVSEGAGQRHAEPSDFRSRDSKHEELLTRLETDERKDAVKRQNEASTPESAVDECRPVIPGRPPASDKTNDSASQYNFQERREGNDCSDSEDSSCEDTSSGSMPSSSDEEGISDDEGVEKKMKSNREQNIIRNEKRLIKLGLKGLSLPKHVDRLDVNGQTSKGEQNEGHRLGKTERKRKKRGMLFSRTAYNNMLFGNMASERGPGRKETPGSIAWMHPDHSSTEQLSPIRKVRLRYPHRHDQIRFLWSIFNSTVRQTASSLEDDSPVDNPDVHIMPNVYVPPPMFVTGPSGTGKTSIVRDVLHALKDHWSGTTSLKSSTWTELLIGMAYVDCATIEPSSIDALLGSAKRQILESIPDGLCDVPKRLWSGKRKRTRAYKKRKIMHQNKQTFPNKSRAVVFSGDDPGNGIKRENPEELSHTMRHDMTREGYGISEDCGEIREKDQGTIKFQYAADMLQAGRSKDICSFMKKVSNEEGIPIDDQEEDDELSDGLDDTDRGDSDEDSYDSDLFEDSIQYHVRAAQRMNTRQALRQEHDSSATIMTGQEVSQDRHRVQLAPRQPKLSRSAHGAPAAFGRALLPVFGKIDRDVGDSGRRGCAFLILDHGERMLEIGTRKKSGGEQKNFLSQLLILPKVMELNLTVIVITSSSLLEHSHANNKTLGTIQDAAQPVRIHFGSYKGKLVFKDILRQPVLQALVVGDDNLYLSDEIDHAGRKEKDMFLQKVYDSFLDTLIQSLETSTRDIREMVRLARILWPDYIAPLCGGSVPVPHVVFSNRDENTSVEDVAVNTDAVIDSPEIICRHAEKQLLEQLDRNAMPFIRSTMRKCLFMPGQGTRSFTGRSNSAMRNLRSSSAANVKKQTRFSPAHELPYLTKFLLLSAFVCQNNRPDGDEHLFTTSGSKKRSKKTTGKFDIGDIAYGSSTSVQQQIRTIRPPIFPLERMLSVCVSMLSLNCDESRLVVPQGQLDVKDFVSNMGTARLFDSIAELRDLGLLREAGGNLVGGRDDASHRMNMTSPKYWCTLQRDEAEDVAESIGFALNKYLMEDY